MSEPWEPTWSLEEAARGEDEEWVIAFYKKEAGLKPWEELDEWQRESWRREFRDL